MVQLSLSARIIGILYRRVFSFWIAVILRSRGVQVGRGVIFYGWPLVQLAPASSIVIEDDCVLCSLSAFTAMGVSRPVTLKTLMPGALLRIGRGVGISGAVICAALAVDIGEESLLGSGCVLVDTDFHPVHPVGRRHAPIIDAKRSAISIGRNAFIGAGAFICKGVSVGSDAVVGAMSVVTKSVPPGEIAAGNPAIILKAVAPTPIR